MWLSLWVDQCLSITLSLSLSLSLTLLEEFTPLASHSVVCAVLCCAVLFCAVLCYVLCNSKGIAPTTQGSHYNPCGFLTFMLKIVIILKELLRRPKATNIILEDL